MNGHKISVYDPRISTGVELDIGAPARYTNDDVRYMCVNKGCMMGMVSGHDLAEALKVPCEDET